MPPHTKMIVQMLTRMLLQRFTLYGRTRARTIMTVEICIRIAPTNMTMGMGVSPAKVAISAAMSPGIYKVRISALSMFIMMKIQSEDSNTLISIFVVALLIGPVLTGFMVITPILEMVLEHQICYSWLTPKFRSSNSVNE